MIGRVKVGKWGNSLAIRIPTFLVEELNIDEGHTFRVWYAEKTIVLSYGPTHKEALQSYLNQAAWEDRWRHPDD